jgi:formate dehydrogenase major subunit
MNSRVPAITFRLDGRDAVALPGESLWDVARRMGEDIPHLCHRPRPGSYRPEHIRACMVEIDGERTLAASCQRRPAPGMVVYSGSARAAAARRMVMELLVADQPPRAEAHDASSLIWRYADIMGVTSSRFAPREGEARRDLSHPAIAVNLDACIACNLCARACRDVQVNDVIGMGFRGDHHAPVFDLDDPMAESTCVACGECVEACPTGALMPASIVDPVTQTGTREDSTSIDSICPFCGVGCQVSFKMREGKIAYVEGRDGPSNENRLCVKGRFGFDYVASTERLTTPLIRLPDAPKGLNIDPANPLSHFRKATWDEALDFAANGLQRIARDQGGQAVAGFGSAKCSNEEAYLFQKLIRTAFGHNNVDHCTRLCHASSVAALMEGIGSGAVTAPFTDALKADAIIVIGANPTENHPVAATYMKQAARRGAALILMDPRGTDLKRHATHMLQFRPGTDVALLNAMMHVIVAEGLVDEGFIDRRTAGYAALKAHLATQTLCPGRARHHLLGHGRQPAHAWHGQRPLPHLARHADRQCRPAGHGAASAARTEQRAGRVGCRPYPDGVPRLCQCERGGQPPEVRGAVGRAAEPCARADGHGDSRRRGPGQDIGNVCDGREPGHVRS